MGTIRSFDPFPKILNTSTSSRISLNRKEQHSETRKPLEYNVSKIARSRNPAIVSVSGCSMIANVSSTESVSGSSRLFFGKSIVSV